MRPRDRCGYSEMHSIARMSSSKPLGPAVMSEIALEVRVQLEQVADVVGRVGELLGCQRAPRPVRCASGPCRSSWPSRRATSSAIADLRRKPSSAAAACVSNTGTASAASASRVRRSRTSRSCRAACRILTLAAIRQQLRMSGSSRQARQRIDQVAIGVRCDLDQAELRIVGALAHELRVDASRDALRRRATARNRDARHL
jgi:hypothetical protein